MKKSGWAIHVHHDIIVEWCYDFEERIKVIKTTKPAAEIPIRLDCFKLLPPEAVADIPLAYRLAGEAYGRAKVAYLQEDAAYWQAKDAFLRAQKAFLRAKNAWEQKDKDAFHAKWCGCPHWNGKEIVFKQER